MAARCSRAVAPRAARVWPSDRDPRSARPRLDVSAGRAAGFPPTARLKTPAHFRETLTQARRLDTGPLRLHVRSGATPAQTPAAEQIAPPAAVARLGITVAKRVAPLAVQRNRIKRIVRESFRRARAGLPVGDYLVQAKPEVARVSASALREALASLWDRAGALKPGTATPTMPARTPNARPSR